MTFSDQDLEAQAALCRAAPSSASPRTRLARMLLMADRPADALQSAQMALAIEAGDAEAQAVRAQALAAIEAMDPALAALELALALRPDDPAPALELGYSYAELARPIDAERAFKRALSIDAASADAHSGLAALYLGVGIDDGAEHHSAAALRLRPGHAVASQTLSSLLERRGEHAQAAAVLDAAYRSQSLFREPGRQARMTVLVLATTSSGNVPYRFLMPPRLYGRLVWYMEHARLDEIDRAGPYDVVFNAIGDPDLAAPSAPAVRQFLSACSKRVLNRPDAVERTRRDRLPALLGALEGVAAPRAVRVDHAACAALKAAAQAGGLTGAVLARPVGSHGGAGLVRVDSQDGLGALGDAFAGQAVYLTQFHAYRSPDGGWRKGRVIFVDRRAYPYHWAVADDWLVHYETSGTADDAARRAEERRFLQDPASVIGQAAWRAVGEIGRALDLDYAGLDFGVLQDGRVLVFEANATMLVHPEPEDGDTAYKNPAVAAIVEAFQAMLQRARHESAAGTPGPSGGGEP
jgi:tetratricopeptide (TPR) repeat protein